MKQIILLRHGETSQKNGRVFQADSAPLSSLGKHQVAAAADVLHRNYVIDLILTSPLTRAIQTTSIIQSQLNIKAVEENILVEMKNPPLIRGKSYDNPEADKAYKKWIEKLEKPYSLEDPYIENYYDLFIRASKVLNQLSELEFTTLLIVTHSELIRAIIANVLLGMDGISKAGKLINRIKIENAHFIVLKQADTGHSDWLFKI